MEIFQYGKGNYEVSDGIGGQTEGVAVGLSFSLFKNTVAPLLPDAHRQRPRGRTGVCARRESWAQG